MGGGFYSYIQYNSYQDIDHTHYKCNVKPQKRRKKGILQPKINMKSSCLWENVRYINTCTEKKDMYAFLS